MNSNYSWQKHHANERLQARFNEAEIHRSLRRKNKDGAHPSYSLGRIVLLPIAGVVALVGRLTSYNRSNEPQSIQNA